jgi:hypothetical protein
LISDVISLDDVPLVFAQLAADRGALQKVLIRPRG